MHQDRRLRHQAPFENRGCISQTFAKFGQREGMLFRVVNTMTAPLNKDLPFGLGHRPNPLGTRRLRRLNRQHERLQKGGRRDG